MMSENPPYTILGLNDFKTNLCRYMDVLHKGGAESYVIRRFRRPVALVTSLASLKRHQKEEEAAAILAARARHAGQRRLVKARLLAHLNPSYPAQFSTR